MYPKIKSLLQEIEAYTTETVEGVELFKNKYTSRKGAIAQLFKELKQLPDTDRQEAGKQLNELKKKAESKKEGLTTCKG